MAGLSPGHLILILVVALLVLGPKRLPETAAALDHAVRSFRDAVEGKEETPKASSDTKAATEEDRPS